MKWLGRIVVGREQSRCFFFQTDYKIIPPGQTFESFDAARTAPVMVHRWPVILTLMRFESSLARLFASVLSASSSPAARISVVSLYVADQWRHHPRRG